VAPLGLLAAFAAGCGNERASPPELGRPDRPTGYQTFVSPDGAVSFNHPSNWGVAAGEGPEVARLYSGTALAAVYAYPRTDLPTGRAAVEDSRRRLLASLRRRAPSFSLIGSHLTEVDGAPAVVVDGGGEIGGHLVVERTIHVYKPGIEFVIDAYAAPLSFSLAERWGFRPLLRTIDLDRASGT